MTTKEQTVAESWLPSEEECSQCHDVIAEQWARSRHHSSFQNPDFARSWAREPLAFCRDCHAPALQRLPPLPDAEAESLGVGCLDCHLEGNTLVTSGSPKEASAAPHALRKSPEFATQSCARCHEFAFPAKTWRPAGTLMQLTMTEHAASQHASRSCSECHMQGHDHSFASTRDPEAMRRALEVTARRKGSALELDLTPVGVGHAFPTGDLYRRLEVHAELVSAEGEQLATATRYLARHFEPRRRPDGRLNYAARLPTPDDRLRGPTTLRLELGV
ncbi:MAG: multiheme c-type cytochrome, partial [Nannocystaceae bacterium]